MEKILGRKSHGRRKRPKRNRCGLGCCPVVKESMGLWRWAGRKAEGWHFSTLSKGLSDSGLYRLDRKGLQYVRSAEERLDWYIAWAGVLMQITTTGYHSSQVV